MPQNCTAAKPEPPIRDETTALRRCGRTLGPRDVLSLDSPECSKKIMPNMSGSWDANALALAGRMLPPYANGRWQSPGRRKHPSAREALPDPAAESPCAAPAVSLPCRIPL